MQNSKTIIDKAEQGEYLSSEEALSLTDFTDLEALTHAAVAVRDRGHPDFVTYSPKVFIPLTKLCRDVCHYCTFAETPKKMDRAYLTADQVLEIALIRQPEPLSGTSAKSSQSKQKKTVAGKKTSSVRHH